MEGGGHSIEREQPEQRSTGLKMCGPFLASKFRKEHVKEQVRTGAGPDS